jgi:hypothetical protein
MGLDGTLEFVKTRDCVISFEVIAPTFRGELSEFHCVSDMRIIPSLSRCPPEHQRSDIHWTTELQVYGSSATLETGNKLHGWEYALDFRHIQFQCKAAALWISLLPACFLSSTIVSIRRGSA